LFVRRGSIFRNSLSSTAALSLFAVLCAPTSAAAQQQPSPPPPAPPATTVPAAPAPAQEQVIVVTGSRIPRPNLTAVSPVTVINSQEVKLQGAVMTESLINSLPQAKPDQGVYVSNGATGTATVDLRAFGAARTLVLINGRRLMPGDPTSPSPDINFIPSALIKRVEVLTGGASSVYGSDAIAGVVNFILDTRLEGFRVDAQSSFYQHDNRNGSGINQLLEDAGFRGPSGNRADGGIQDVNGAYGLKFADGRAHVTLYGGYRSISAVTQDSRDYSACTVAANTAEDPVACGGSGTSLNGTFTTKLRGRFRPTFDRQFVSPPEFFNFAPYNYFQRPGRRYTAGGFADAEISDAFKPYLEIMFMDDQTVSQVAPSGNFGNTNTINCDNPLLSAQQLALVCTEGNFVGETPIFNGAGVLVGVDGSPTPFIDPVTGATYFKGTLRIQRRSTEAGPRQEILTHRDWRGLAGMKGDIARGLSYDASYLVGNVKMTDVHTNDVLVSRLGLALDVVSDPSTGQPVCRAVLTGEDPECVPWDVFAVGAATAESGAYISVPSILNGEVTQKVANASLTAQLGDWGIRSPWADDGPAFNAGAEYRSDKLIVDPDEHFQNADLSGLPQPVLALTGKTSVKELFAETRVPLLQRHLIENLTLEGGYRLSWYKNGDNRFSATSYKLALDLTPIRGIRFRASQQRAVRAPNVQELFAPIVPDFLTVDPCAGVEPTATEDQCARTGVTLAQYGHILQNPFESDEGDQAITGGNIALGPETARTRTIGIVLQPRFLPGFSATLDWWDIRLKGAVETIGADLIMDTCLQTGDPLFCNRIHRDSEGTLWATPQGFIDNTNANLSAFESSGLDVGASYGRRLGRLGSVNLEFIGTWTHKWFVDAGGLSEPFDCAGLFGPTCGFPTPRWRHNARATFSMPSGLSLSLLWRHTSAIPIDLAQKPPLEGPFNPAVKTIAAQDFFDLTALFSVAGRYSLRFGVRNLFDREPPVIAGGQFGTCGPPLCTGNILPQLYDPLGRFIFAGVTVNFKELF
jgi:outer membrane receptor protein involved in Fe transport